MPTTLQALTSLGQSPWYDNIERRLLLNGELAAMIASGDIRGVTSNPSIFNNAIARSTDYDARLAELAHSGASAAQIYESLVIEDIQAAADLFSGLYRESQGADGYVSLEVNPLLAHDTQGTINEALRLWKDVSRPNLMVKIPATQAGIPAIRKVISAGVNVNVTLIFALDRYQAVMDAYLSGLEDRLAAGQGIDSIASVASFFVSRIDSKTNKYLDVVASQTSLSAGLAASLKGRIAIASARLAYQQFLFVFNSPRFSALKSQGARLQRPLWASTSTKDPAYPDTIYVDTLIGPDTVNTLPPQTLAAFKDHGVVQRTVDQDLAQAQQDFSDLAQLGISIAQITTELEQEGVQAFADAFNALMQTIETRRQAFLA
jgi:transaldolase